MGLVFPSSVVDFLCSLILEGGIPRFAFYDKIPAFFIDLVL